MIGNNSRKGYHHHEGKQEDHEDQHQNHTIDNNSIEKLYQKAASSSSTRQWSGLRNPRIVRVSRSFGGKDRHSKVCTIRGLRDRRIRLSVPTAIQLYDLQDRLGLSQPSKVIDWLIEATKHDIDKLPPLPIPHGFPQFQQTLLPSAIPIHHHAHESASIANSSLGAFFDANSFMDKGKWVKGNNSNNNGGEENEEDGGSGHQPQNLFPIGANFLSNNSVTYTNNNNNSYHNSGPSSNLSLFGSHGLDTSHSSLQFHQLPSPSLFCPTSAAFGPYYAPFINMNTPNSNSSLGEAEARVQQLNHIQWLSPTSSSQVLNPHHIPSLKPLIPTLPFSSRLLDLDQKDITLS